MVGKAKHRFSLDPGVIDIAKVGVENEIRLLRNFPKDGKVTSVVASSPILLKTELKDADGSNRIAVTIDKAEFRKSQKDETVRLAVREGRAESFVLLRIHDSSRLIVYPKTVFAKPGDGFSRFKTAVYGNEMVLQELSDGSRISVTGVSKSGDKIGAIPAEIECTDITPTSVQISLQIASAWIQENKNAVPIEAYGYLDDGRKVFSIRLFFH